MLKLKIGQNYLIIDHTRRESANYQAIAYMMGCFKGQNKVACYLTNETNIRDLVKIVNESHLDSLYVLWSMNIKQTKASIRKLAGRMQIEGWAMYYEQITYTKDCIKKRLEELKALAPNLKVKVIDDKYIGGCILENELENVYIDNTILNSVNEKI